MKKLLETIKKNNLLYLKLSSFQWKKNGCTYPTIFSCLASNIIGVRNLYPDSAVVLRITC